MVKMLSYKNRKRQGVVLLELIVSIGLFIIVMFISVGSFLVVLNSHRQALATRKGVDSLAFVLEDVVRISRLGSLYHCDSSGTITLPQDCAGGAAYLVLEPSGGDTADSTDQVIYMLDSSSGKGIVKKSVDGGTIFIPLNSPDVDVQDLKFYVSGSDELDGNPARILITLKSLVDTGKVQVPIQLQTTVAERSPDF